MTRLLPPTPQPDELDDWLRRNTDKWLEDEREREAQRKEAE